MEGGETPFKDAAAGQAARRARRRPRAALQPRASALFARRARRRLDHEPALPARPRRRPAGGLLSPICHSESAVLLHPPRAAPSRGSRGRHAPWLPEARLGGVARGWCCRSELAPQASPRGAVAPLASHRRPQPPRALESTRRAVSGADFEPAARASNQSAAGPSPAGHSGGSWGRQPPG